MDLESLNDRQIYMLDEVLGRADPDDRPDWPRGWGRTLRDRISGELVGLSDDLPDRSFIRIDKFRLGEVLMCEGRHEANEALEGPFAWDVPRVRGTVSHHAMERLVLEPGCGDPLDIARWAIEDLSKQDGNERSPAEFLKNLQPSENHELVRSVNDLLVKFTADFPPLPAAWLPRCESPIKLRFGVFALRAVPDLAIGRAQGTTARAVLVELKTGNPYPTHPQDAAFYALADTLRSGTPPFRIVTYYVDSGEASVCEVDEGVLLSAEKRVLEGARRMAKLARGERAVLSPGSGCWRCPRREDCSDGQEYVNRGSEDITPG